MASIYQRTYTRPIPDGAEIIIRDGHKVARFQTSNGRMRCVRLTADGSRLLLLRRCWYVTYKVGRGKGAKRVTVKAYPDKKASLKYAEDLETRAARKDAGIRVVDPEKAHARIAEVLEDYLADVKVRGKSEVYIYTIRKLIKKLAEKCGWTALCDMRSEGFLAWRTKKVAEGRSARTVNAYLEAAAIFLNWCVRHGKLEGNALEAVQAADQNIDPRRIRRALTVEELTKLLAAAGDRRLCYLTAVLTGLRRKELRRLIWGDVVLDVDLPHIKLRVKATKSKRPDTIPLAPELVDALRAASSQDFGHDTPVFPTVPILRTYKADLDRAGIRFKNDAGHQADFHALRMTYNMLLAKEAVPLRTAMRLMRHTDPKLTAVVYTDPAMIDAGAAVGKLPRLIQKADESDSAATGAAQEK